MQSNGARGLLTAVTVLSAACTRAPSLHSEYPVNDSITIHINSRKSYNYIDIFIYADTLTQPLESHKRFEGSHCFIKMPSGGGDKIAVALANVRGDFKELPSSFEVMEKLTMNYASEDPSAPLQSGYGFTEAGATLELEVAPLLCPVRIKSVCYLSDAPLTDAIIQLEGVSSQAEIFRSNGFHPSQTLNSPGILEFPFMMLQDLPSVIGSSPQRTDITLYCYPNEDADGLSGGTALRINGMSSGKEKSFRIPLGPVRRGHEPQLDIELK